MLYADIGERRVLATPHSRATCSFCGGTLIAKCGAINIWHWAHESRTDCDTWSEGETEWHLSWKANFPAEQTEITISKNGQRHRADVVLKDGTVIEFQHSPISPSEIEERELFYGRMIWVFDLRGLLGSFNGFSDIYNDDHSRALFVMKKKEGNYRTFRWKHARKSIAYTTQKTYFDFGGKITEYIFELGKMYPDTPCGGWGYYKEKKKFLEEYQ